MELRKYLNALWTVGRGKKRFEHALPLICENTCTCILDLVFKCVLYFDVQDKAQMTMLVTWLIELYLNQLGELKEQGMDESDEYNNIQEEFRKFLSQARVKVPYST